MKICTIGGGSFSQRSSGNTTNCRDPWREWILFFSCRGTSHWATETSPKRKIERITSNKNLSTDWFPEAIGINATTLRFLYPDSQTKTVLIIDFILSSSVSALTRKSQSTPASLQLTCLYSRAILFPSFERQSEDDPSTLERLRNVLEKFLYLFDEKIPKRILKLAPGFRDI